MSTFRHFGVILSPGFDEELSVCLHRFSHDGPGIKRDKTNKYNISTRTKRSIHPHTCTSTGGAVAQSIERATPGEEVPFSIRAMAARSLLVGSVSV